jgi:hypothetical protein
MQSKATTVDQFLAGLTEDRRKVLQAVREVVLNNLDKDYDEGIQYGMIGYYVPHRVYPAGYHCDPKQPLPFAGLASHKNYMSLYLMCVYGDSDHLSWFQRAWAQTGKKLDMGKCCVRFRKLDDLALDVIAEAIRRVPAKKFIERCEATVKPMNKRTAKGAGEAGGSSELPKPAKSRTPARKSSRDAK